MVRFHLVEGCIGTMCTAAGGCVVGGYIEAVFIKKFHLMEKFHLQSLNNSPNGTPNGTTEINNYSYLDILLYKVPKERVYFLLLNFMPKSINNILLPPL